MYELFKDLGAWLVSGEQWAGPDGIAHRLAEHLQYSLLATLIAAAIALPLGLLIGHTGRGAFLAINLSSLRPRAAHRRPRRAGLPGERPVHVARLHRPRRARRARPSSPTPTPGMTAVDPEVKDAARGQGMRGHQVLFQVELPLALPLIMTGLRLALIQVVATATIAAYVSFGGLGRYVFDGLAQRDLVQVLGGAVLVARRRRRPRPRALRPAARPLPPPPRPSRPRSTHQMAPITAGTSSADSSPPPPSPPSPPAAAASPPWTATGPAAAAAAPARAASPSAPPTSPRTRSSATSTPPPWRRPA